MSSSTRFLRWFSPAYRYALKSEAEGRYVEAARAYALCGQHLKVAEMHILEAECRGAPESALRELHVAAHFAEASSDDAESRALLLRLGQSYLRILKKSVITPAERDLCADAAQLLLRGGDPLAAATAYELGGDLSQAARVYEQAGEIEKLEQLHEIMTAQRTTQEEEHALWQAVELHLDLGERAAALAALERLGRLGSRRGEDRGARAHEQRAALLARQPAPFLVTLRLSSPRESLDLVCVGRLPLLLGRGAGTTGDEAEPQARSLRFADPGLSRQHCQIEWLTGPEGASPRFALRDLGSKNGTRLGGLPIEARVALPPAGELGLGEQVRLRFVQKSAPTRLELTVESGLLRGRQVVLCEEELALPLTSEEGEPGADEPSRPAAATVASPLVLAFDAEGQPHLRATPELRLNGKRVGQRVQLLRGDRLSVGELQLEVA